MKTVDTTLIMSFRPCREWPESRVREAVPEEIPIVDFLRADHIPPQDRLWVALHEDLCTDSIMRIFACTCAERTLLRERAAGREPNKRSWTAVAVARRYARGEATDAELDDASAAARAAASAAAWNATRSAAGASARAAARAAASAAAWNAARYAAAGAAARAAGNAAWYGARAAAWADEEKRQCEHLAQMLEEMK
jgi:hypothetical protein